MLTKAEAQETIFTEHVVLAIFADEDSPNLGLRNLIMPLRASNITIEDLRHVVILANINFLKR